MSAIHITEMSGLPASPRGRKSENKGITDTSPPNAKTLQKLPDLHKEAELEQIAKQINESHAKTIEYAELTIKAGTGAVEQAIECGKLLLTVKADKKRGQFESWCETNLSFSIRKVQYYMLLARKYPGKDIQRLKPHSIRQALIYAGALPEDGSTKRRAPKFDDLSRLRKKVRAVMLELKAHEHEQELTESLIKETDPIEKWRTTATRKIQRNGEGSVLDIGAEIQPEK